MIVKDQNKRASSKEIFEKLKVSIKFILKTVEKIFKCFTCFKILLFFKRIPLLKEKKTFEIAFS